MDHVFHVTVTRAGRGYLAENASLEISAGGASPAEAAEKARAMAYEVLRNHDLRHPKITAWMEDGCAAAIIF